MARRKVNREFEPLALERDAIYPQRVIAERVFDTTPNALAVQRCIGKLRIPVVRIGTRIFFKGADVLDYITENTGRARKSKAA